MNTSNLTPEEDIKAQDPLFGVNVISIVSIEVVVDPVKDYYLWHNVCIPPSER